MTSDKLKFESLDQMAEATAAGLAQAAADFEPQMNANKRQCKEDLIYKDEVYRIVGAAMNVSNNLGCGFLEAVYQEVLGIEFSDDNVPFEAQKRTAIK